MCMGGNPSVQPFTPAPRENDPAAEAARAKERLLARLKRGRQSTILSGVDNQGSGQSNTLLGGGGQ